MTDAVHIWKFSNDQPGGQVETLSAGDIYGQPKVDEEKLPTSKADEDTPSRDVLKQEQGDACSISPQSNDAPVLLPQAPDPELSANQPVSEPVNQNEPNAPIAKSIETHPEELIMFLALLFIFVQLEATLRWTSGQKGSERRLAGFRPRQGAVSLTDPPNRWHRTASASFITPPQPWTKASVA